ncbi:Gfo/Idh/MocA family protein [Candidatus Allofournierella excrementavium]|uniref:Gfo/Idh/MocA family protein n=1 Tax=Candidatus Allofournierella excrementavium TaxID=2838591 RepID=UPI00374F5C21
MKQLKAGVVGVGFIGAVHIEQLRRLGNVEVVALADEAGAQEKADALYVPHAYTNYKDMIDNEQLDCVHICTPNSTHYEIAMYAMERGVNVVCEKPMTCTVEEAEKLRAYAKEKGLVNAMNFNCRFYPMAYQMRQMVRSGEVGDIYTVHGGYLQDWLFLDTDYSWRLEPEFTGASRAFADIGSHWIDLVEYITGLRAVEVLADFAIFHKTRKKPTKEIATYSGMALRPEDYEEVPITTEDYATVLFHMENGACVSCNISQVFAGRKNQMIVSVAGSRCALHWDSENSNALWIGRRERDNGELVKDPSILDDGTKGVISYPGGHVEGFPDTFKQNFKKIYAAIAGGKPEDYATFDDGLREMVLCEKIVESARERRWVSLA